MTTTATTELIESHEARALILAGDAPTGMRVRGALDFSNVEQPFVLPEALSVRRLTLRGCAWLAELPRGLRCYELDARHTALQRLPDDLRVEFRIDLEGCDALAALPDGLAVGSLVLRDCIALAALPEALDVCFLDITGCTRLTHWPRNGSVRIGRLLARGCTRLEALPEWITTLSQLDISGCANLATLPPTLRVSSWIDVADTAITALPKAMQGVELRWRGVPVDMRVAFEPESITGAEVLAERNAERRRVLLERMGYNAFLAQVHARALHHDEDAGGERRLLRVDMADDEPLVCLAVYCPSTGRQYLLRVPPAMRTCHQAAAWIAGFDNPNDYKLVAET